MEKAYACDFLKEKKNGGELRMLPLPAERLKEGIHPGFLHQKSTLNFSV